MAVVCLQIFKVKECLKKKHHAISIIMLDSVIKAKKKQHPRTVLEECKYEKEKKKMENFIDDDLEKSESDESDIDSNDETESNDESNE